MTTAYSALARFGMRATSVVIACRYPYSALEMSALNGIEEIAVFLKAFLQRPATGRRMLWVL